MNRKGQMEMVGIMLIAVIAIIVGLAFYQVIGKTVGDVTTTVSNNANVTYTMAVEGSSVELTTCGQKVITGLVYNRSSGLLMTQAGNYSFVQIVGSDGYLAAALKTSGSVEAGKPVNVSCNVFEPDGYITDSGGRAITMLIILFCALGILTFALVPTLRNGVLDLIGR